MQNKITYILRAIDILVVFILGRLSSVAMASTTSSKYREFQNDNRIKNSSRESLKTYKDVVYLFQRLQLGHELINTGK